MNKLDKKLNNFDSAENPNEQLIGIKSHDHLTKLAEDIKKYAFPRQWKASNGKSKEDGVLVVVTEQLEQKDIFYQAEVWRGFASNAEKTPVTETEVIVSPLSRENYQSEEKKKVVQSQSKGKSRSLIPLTIILLILILVLVIITPQRMKSKRFNPSLQKTPTQQESQEENSHPPLILIR
jgi:hypothetical protein